MSTSDDGILSSLRYLFADFLDEADTTPPFLPLGLPAGAEAVVSEGIHLLMDYQGASYAKLYVERLQRFIGRQGTNPQAVEPAIFCDIARLMARRMAYEDAIRIAQVKLAEYNASGGRIRSTEIHRFRFDELVDALPAHDCAGTGEAAAGGARGGRDGDHDHRLRRSLPPRSCRLACDHRRPRQTDLRRRPAARRSRRRNRGSPRRHPARPAPGRAEARDCGDTGEGDCGCCERQGCRGGVGCSPSPRRRPGPIPRNPWIGPGGNCLRQMMACGYGPRPSPGRPRGCFVPQVPP